MAKFSRTDLLIIALVALVTWNVRGCLTKSPPNEKLIRSEEQLKAIEARRISDSLITATFLQVKDDSIASLREQLLNNGVRLQANKNNYDKVKPVIIDYSREQLRAEASRYTVPAN